MEKYVKETIIEIYKKDKDDLKTLTEILNKKDPVVVKLESGSNSSSVINLKEAHPGIEGEEDWKSAVPDKVRGLLASTLSLCTLFIYGPLMGQILCRSECIQGKKEDQTRYALKKTAVSFGKSKIVETRIKSFHRCRVGRGCKRRLLQQMR